MKAGRRQNTRRRLLRTGLLFGASDLKFSECVIWNISDGGAMIEVPRAVEVAATGRVICETINLNRAYSLIWREGPKIGVAFAG